MRRLSQSRFAAAILFPLALAGCAAIEGRQKPLTAEDVSSSVCPSETDIDGFASELAANRGGAYRDKVISKCVAAIDRNYNTFKAALQSQTASTNLAVDVLALGLTAASSATSGETAKDLAIGATGVLGTGAAINKDVFYQQTLPAIESAMDDYRTQIQIRIVKSQMADRDATEYTLYAARSDITAYEAAGNIYNAISELTKTASQQASASQDILQTTKVSYQAQVLDTPTYERVKALVDKIKAYADAGNLTRLNMIATALGLPLSADVISARNSVRLEIARRVTSSEVSDPKAAMDALAAKLEPYTREDK